jgi:hypothetical protein
MPIRNVRKFLDGISPDSRDIVRSGADLNLKGKLQTNYEKLQKSLNHLKCQFENYRQSDQRLELTELDRE